MSRKNRKYTFEEKLQVTKMHVENGIGSTTIANKFNCIKNRILLWSKKYQEDGEKALIYKTRGRSSTGRPKNKKFNNIEEELEYVKAKRNILKNIANIEQTKKKIRFQVIFELRKTYQVKFLCNILKVSKSGYYKWLKNKEYSNEIDQGFQYTNPIVQKILKDNNFLQSMSRKGTPIDNTPTESFFSTLKSELIYNTTIDK